MHSTFNIGVIGFTCPVFLEGIQLMILPTFLLNNLYVSRIGHLKMRCLLESCSAHSKPIPVIITRYNICILLGL